MVRSPESYIGHGLHQNAGHCIGQDGNVSAIWLASIAAEHNQGQPASLTEEATV
jgi:hypothetical protein